MACPCSRHYMLSLSKRLVFEMLKVLSGLFSCLLLSVALTATGSGPAQKIKVSGAVTDMILIEANVFVSTDAGTIEQYNLKTGRKMIITKLPGTKDFMGDPIPAKIFSIDKISGKILAVSLGHHGFRNLLIIENGRRETVISADRDKMMIKKARWIDSHTVLLGLLGNDLLLFDTGSKKIINKMNISPYTFSDFSLSEDRHRVYTADESGIVHEIDLNKWVVTQNYTGINLDNIYKIVYKSGVIITGGQDRRVGIYNTITGKNYFIRKNFLVYSVGLNKDGNIGAYSASEKNDISIFMTSSGDDIRLLHGHESVITGMEFFNDHTLVSAGDDRLLIIWKFD